MPLESTCVEYIEYVTRNRGCLEEYESAMRRVSRFVDYSGFGPDNLDRRSVHEGYAKLVYPTYKYPYLNLNSPEYGYDTWLYKLAVRFSSQPGEPTPKDIANVVWCVEFLMKVLGKPKNVISNLKEMFGHFDPTSDAPILDAIRNAGRKVWRTYTEDRFECGDFDEYNIERLYPALYEWAVEPGCFDSVYMYRETVPDNVKEFIDYVMYLHTYREICPSILAGLLEIDYVGLYGNVLLVRKGTKIPIVSIGLRRIDIERSKTHINVALALPGSNASGTIFKEWGFHTRCIYGMDSTNLFRTIRLDLTIRDVISTASVRTRYIFDQLLECEKPEHFRRPPNVPIRYWNAESDPEDPLGLHAFRPTIPDDADENIKSLVFGDLYQQPCECIIYKVWDIVDDFPEDFNRLLRSIDDGLDVDEIVEIATRTHKCKHCNCNAELRKFLDIITSG